MQTEEPQPQNSDLVDDRLHKVSIRFPLRIALAMRERSKLDGVSLISLIEAAVKAFHHKYATLLSQPPESLDVTEEAARRRLNQRIATYATAREKKIHGRVTEVVGTKLSDSTIRLIEEMKPQRKWRGRVVALAVAEYVQEKGSLVARWNAAAVEEFTLDLPPTFRDEQNKLLPQDVAKHEYGFVVGKEDKLFRGVDVVLTSNFLLHLFGLKDRTALGVLSRTRYFCRSLSVTTSDFTHFVEMAGTAYTESKKSSPEMRDESSFRSRLASIFANFLEAGIDEIPIAPSDMLLYYERADGNPASIVATLRARQADTLRTLNVFRNGDQIGYSSRVYWEEGVLPRIQAAY